MTRPRAWLWCCAAACACEAPASAFDAVFGPVVVVAADAGSDDGGLPDAGAADAGPPDAGACGPCATYSTTVANDGTVANPALTEISGVAPSRVHPGVLYTHNDSGGLPRIYMLSRSGAALGELALTGAQNVDWEDLAVGPCPAGSCIFVADVGDNAMGRPTPYYVYRVQEPATVPMGTVSVAFERIEVQYPGGARFNCETLLIHPVTGDLYVVTKHGVGVKSSAYKAAAPLSTAGPNALALVAGLAVPDGADLPITGGDIDPCGGALLLRSYNTLYELRLAPGSAFDAIFTAPFTRVPVAAEPQGEAVCWLPGGGYLSVSEGAGATLHSVACQ